MTILMCRPDHFRVEYEINPWMRLDVPVERRLAARQWEALRRTYVELGESVELAEPVAGLPDMVFTANAAVVRGGRAVLSRFRHPERRGEEPHWERVLTALGLETVRLPEGLCFEGAGDALFVGDRLFCGHGFRSDRRAHPAVGEALGVETASLELVDPRYYHLDTCFCPIDDRTVLLHPAALSPDSLRLVAELVPRVIEAPPALAREFVCNALPVRGRLVSTEAARSPDGLAPSLREAGLEAVGLPMSEFLKSGGGVRCLSLPLDV